MAGDQQYYQEDNRGYHTNGVKMEIRAEKRGKVSQKRKVITERGFVMLKVMSQNYHQNRMFTTISCII